MDTFCREPAQQSLTPPARGLRRRLLPLQLATVIQGIAFWVPVEKLFMSQIGFDAASVGLMAAAYAAVVPILEVPAGIVSDRWSRKAVLIGASLAIAGSALIGGLSHSVSTYIVGALLLGVYFALYSGSIDSVVYDTVLEETGSGDRYETEIGRVRALESAALVASALLGGWLAELTSPRLMYFLTIPFALASVLAYLAFREPQLHRSEAPTSLRSHLTETASTVARNPAIVPVVALTVVCSTTLMLLFEFGPLWLVALGTSAVFFGPQWAILMATLGFGGLLAGRLQLTCVRHLVPAAAVLVVSTLVLTTSHSALLVTLAQGMLAFLLVIAGIHANAMLHSQVASTVRASVLSGVSAVSWMVFLPIALGFGALAQAFGIHAAAWVLVALSVLMVGLLSRRRDAEPVPAPVLEQVAA